MSHSKAPEANDKKKDRTPNSRILMIIPTLGRRPDLLSETLQSLADQSIDALDIIVVCPHDNVETRELAAKFGASVADDPGNLSGAVNVGLALAKPWHEYAAWMGDDDLLTPNSLEITSTALDAHPNAVLAFGYCDYIDSKGHRLITSRAGKLAPWLMSWGPNLVPLPGILFRLSTLQSTDGFDTSLRFAMDLDMLLRLRKKGPFVNTKKTLASFRWHANSLTVSSRNLSLDEATMVRRRYLPRVLRFGSPLWEKPLRLVNELAAKRVNALALKRS